MLVNRAKDLLILATSLLDMLTNRLQIILLQTVSQQGLFLSISLLLLLNGLLLKEELSLVQQLTR